MSTLTVWVSDRSDRSVRRAGASAESARSSGASRVTSGAGSASVWVFLTSEAGSGLAVGGRRFSRVQAAGKPLNAARTRSSLARVPTITSKAISSESLPSNAGKVLTTSPISLSEAFSLLSP